MKEYAVETYRPLCQREPLAATARRIRDAADQLARSDTPIRYVRTIFAPEDELCLHVFRADSVETVALVSVRAAIEHGRIIEVTERC
jgi:hypothetical protein